MRTPGRSPWLISTTVEATYGTGISKEGDILDLGTAMNIVEKSGAWYSFNGERLGQGRENVRKFLVENTDIRSRVVDLIKEKSGLKKIKEEVEAKKVAKDEK